jgi:hypothetical protein
MSRLAITGILTLAIFLLAAGVVLAQDATPTPGERIDGPGVTASTCPLLNGDASGDPAQLRQQMQDRMNDPNGPMNGQNMGDMMNGENGQKMRDAMNSGNWEEMHNTCQNAMNGQSGPSEDGTQTNPTTSARRGMMGQSV